jgi:type VII secretion integral membrane protein EccD
LVEDVIDAIAVLDESPQFDRDALNRFIGAAIPVVATATAVVSFVSWLRSGQAWWWTVALAILVLLALAGSWQAWVRFKNAAFCESLLIAGAALLAAGAATAVPLPRGYTSAGAPASRTATTEDRHQGERCCRCGQLRAEVAAFSGTLAVAGTAAAIAFGYGWSNWVAAAAVAIGLIVVTNAAKLTVAVARIALPPIPAPGEKISHEELLDPVVDPQSLSDESSTWKAIIASVPESAARLTERSDLAKRLLVGFVAAGTLILTAGSIAVVVQGHFLIHSTVVAGLVTVICAFRSRLYAERWCAWWLLAASVAIPIGVMARYCLWFPGWAWAAVAVFIVLAIAALVLVGATEGIRRVSPVVRRVLELVDGIAIAAVIPLLLWIAGVYDMLRNMRF